MYAEQLAGITASSDRGTGTSRSPGASGSLDLINERYRDGAYTSARVVVFPDGDVQVSGAHLGPRSSSRRPRASEEEKQQKAIDRARRMVFTVVKFQACGYLWTLTYRGCQPSRSQLLHDVDLFERKVRRVPGFEDFALIGVPELHEGEGENSGGFHLHFAVEKFYPVELLRRCWWEVVGEAQGNVDVQGPRYKRGHKVTSGYLAKYLSKQDQEGSRQKGEHRYFISRRFKVPVNRKYVFSGRPAERLLQVVAWALEQTFSERSMLFKWHSEDGGQFLYRTFL